MGGGAQFGGERTKGKVIYWLTLFQEFLHKKRKDVEENVDCINFKIATDQKLLPIMEFTKKWRLNYN